MIEVYPTLSGPVGGFGPHFRIENGKMFRDHGHPKGRSFYSCCHQDGDYFYKGFFDCDDVFTKTWPHPIFVVRGNLLYTQSGHPDGQERLYYEIRT